MPSGGKRPGAGRQPDSVDGRKEMMCFRFSPDIRRFLKGLPEMEMTKRLEAIVRRSRAFKEWKR